MRYPTLFFDLDGTLTNSMEGIVRSLEYAFDEMGMERPSRDVLRKFIGPPLTVSFHELMHFDDETTELAIAKYRERYLVKGLYENFPFDGIPDLLEAVKNSGKTLVVATSKPEFMAKAVTDHFDLTKYFVTVAGSCDESEDKAAVIRKACKRLGLPEHAPDGVLMIGDRKHDIIGAHQCGIPCCGVRFGFAPDGEFEEYGADYIVDTVDDLKNFLLTI